MSKGNEPTRKHGPRLTSTTYPELYAGLEQQLLRLRKLVRREGQWLVAQSHVIDAAMAHLLTRSVPEQEAIIAEGKRLVTLLEALEAEGEPLMPGTYGAASAPHSEPDPVPKKGNDFGKDTVGRSTTIPEIVARNTRGAARGPKRKQKRPKPEGRPLVGIDD